MRAFLDTGGAPVAFFCRRVAFFMAFHGTGVSFQVYMCEVSSVHDIAHDASLHIVLLWPDGQGKHDEADKDGGAVALLLLVAF